MDYASVTEVVRQLSDILVERDISSINIRNRSITLEVRRDKRALVSAVGLPQGPPLPAEVEQPGPTGSGTAEQKKVKAVVSPNVGIFRLADPKTKDLLVAVGKTIKQGQKVGFVEAMGQQFSVVCDVAGRTVRILVEDGQPVEYDQPVLEVEEE